MNDNEFTPTPLQELILYVLQGIDRGVGKIELAKIIYLIEVESAKLTGEILTDEYYTRQKWGPLSRNFTDAIDDMDGNEVAISISPRYRAPKQSHSVGDESRFEPELSPQAALIVDMVIARVKARSPQEIEEMAYDTEPMRVILEEEHGLGGLLLGSGIDFDLVTRHPRLERWRKNKAIHESASDPEYEEFLAEERRMAAEMLKY